MSKSTAKAVLCMVFAASMLPVSAMAEEVKQPANSVAEIRVSPTRIDWLPAIDAERWVLTVAGPGDLFIRRPFVAGTTPSLGLFVADGDRLPDGSYAWELQGIPPTHGTGKLPKRPLALSGRFSVQAGNFVAAPEGTGVGTPEAPLRSVTAKIASDKLVVQGNACIGGGCLLTDTDFPVLRLKLFRPGLLFDDVGDPEDNIPGHDWALETNPSAAQFSIADVENGTVPFTLAGGAPDNSLYVSSNGNVGSGTTSPAAPLHVSRSTGGILEGILLSNNNEARISIQNTNLSVKYIMAVNNFATGEFFISRDGGGGPIVEVNRRLDGGGAPSLKVNGSVQATNVVFSSSRELKEGFASLDPQEVLTKVASLPISKWHFKEGPAVEHIGPMAEDFHAAFGLSSDVKTISMTDSSGVALAAIQGLNARLKDKDQEIAELRARLESLERLLQPKPKVDG